LPFFFPSGKDCWMTEVRLLKINAGALLVHIFFSLIDTRIHLLLESSPNSIHPSVKTRILPSGVIVPWFIDVPIPVFTQFCYTLFGSTVSLQNQTNFPPFPPAVCPLPSFYALFHPDIWVVLKFPPPPSLPRHYMK